MFQACFLKAPRTKFVGQNFVTCQRNISCGSQLKQLQKHGALLYQDRKILTNSTRAAQVETSCNFNSLTDFKSRKNLEQLMSLQFRDEFIPSHQLGPDYVMPTDKFFATNLEDAVKLRVGSKSAGDFTPTSLVSVLLNTVKQSGQKPALSVKRNGVWQHWNFNQYWQDISTVAKAFLKLGLQRHHPVGLLGFNSPEWVISFWGAICAGGVGTGIYTTNSVDACKYVLEHSQTNIVIVENECQLQKILPFRNQLPYLKAIIQYTGTPTHEDVFSWDDVLKLGRTVNDECLNTRIKSLAVNQAAILMYTSGTTGNPKASMSSHDNLVANVKLIKDYMDHKDQNERVVSFLPLNHIVAQLVDLYGAVDMGGHVYFANPDALKGSLLETLLEVRPTFLLAVPRVWDKLREGLEDGLSKTSNFKQALVKLAMNRAYKYSKNILKGHMAKPYSYRIVEPIIKKLQAAIGLDKTNCWSTGGPVSQETIEFYLRLNVFLCEAFGMTESGPHIISFVKQFRIGSVGKVSRQNEFELRNQTEDGGEGELCIRGRNIFMGYLFEEKKTLETLDSDFWLRTGDISKLDKDGFLCITGRIKELLITDGGENIAPLLIEDNVKAALPLISQAVAIGDKRQYLTMLLTVKTELDKDTMLPTDKLTPVSIQWCRSVGSNANTIQELLKDDRVLKAIQKGIDKANEKAISRPCHIQKWQLLPRDFTIQSDEIGPTMKMKRHVIYDRYKDAINNMYV